MDDIWYYITQFLDFDVIIVLSHVNVNLFKITRAYKNKVCCDLIYNTLNKRYNDVTNFFIKQQYDVSLNSVNLAIKINHFEFLNRIDFNKKLTIDSLKSAIQSNNIKMVKFIKNKLKHIHFSEENVVHDILCVDNPDIYKFLIKGSLHHDQLQRLINYNCFNIIELYRFGNSRRGFEAAVVLHANHTNNHFMIQYCIENDYDNINCKIDNEIYFKP
jgi:hypothetical protein